MGRPIFSATWVALFAAVAFAQAGEPTRIQVNGVELSYIERGHGAALVLVPGGTGDYSSWQPQLEPFSQRFRVISYSRRYSYPNDNAVIPGNYSPLIDAEDLAALIRKLDLHDVRIVGQSVGAFAALAFTLAHPDEVHSLVLSEPPVHQLVRGTREGDAAYEDFMSRTWRPAGSYFSKGNSQEAMRVFTNGIFGANHFESLPPEARAGLMRNARAMQALAMSSDPLPMLAKADLQHLRVPVLIVTGENTIKLHKLVNAELARLIPNAQTVSIPNAGHGSSRENAPAFNAAVLPFLERR